MSQVNSTFFHIFHRIQFIKPCSVRCLDGALLVHVSPWFKWQRSTQAMGEEILVYLDTTPESNYVIIDLSDNDPDIDVAVQSFNSFLRGTKSWLRHPNLKELFFITHDSILSRTNTYTDSFQLGRLQVRVFHKLETALSYIDRRT